MIRKVLFILQGNWNGYVEVNIKKYKPDYIVLKTGNAELKGFEGSLIMGKDDVVTCCNFAYDSKVIFVHMDTINQEDDKIDEKNYDNKNYNQQDNKNENNALIEDSESNNDELEEEFRNLVIKDATPLSIGIGVAGGTMTKIIPKLTGLPNHNEKKFFKKTFTIFKDYQQSYTVRIYEGENELIKNNFLLGEFTVSGFEPKKRGEIVIEIIFYLDHDSILTVKARQNDEIEKELTIKNRDQYSKEELDKMIKHAKTFERQENNRKRIDEIRTKMEDIISRLKNNDDDYIQNQVVQIENWINYNPKGPLEKYESFYKELMDLENQI